MRRWTQKRGISRRAGALALAIVLLLAAGAVAVHAGISAGYDLTRWSVDGGGGSVGGGAGYALTGTVGQPGPGPALEGSGYTLVGGFWCAAGRAGGDWEVYLPLVVR